MSEKFNAKKAWLFAAGLVVSVLVTFYQGWVASALWGWFVTPSFGILSPSVVALAGIILLAKLLTYQISLTDFKMLLDKQQPDATSVRWLGLLVSFLVSTSFVVGGWILSWFM